MRPMTRLSLQSLIVVFMAVALGLVFNAHNPQGLPLFGSTPPAIPKASYEIPLDQAQALVQAGQAVFVDARDEFSFADGHIQGALSLPEENFDYAYPLLESQLTGKICITYCEGEHCRLSHDLADKLQAQGLDVRVVVNGWGLWLEADLPVSSGS